MGNWAGNIIGILIIGIAIGLIFKLAYPEVTFTPEIGTLIALVSVILVLVLRKIWAAVRGAKT